MQDIQKNLNHHPGNLIVTWLLHFWDNGNSSSELAGRKTKHVKSLYREEGSGKDIGKQAQDLSCWRQLLSGMKDRYSFKKVCATQESGSPCRKASSTSGK